MNQTKRVSYAKDFIKTLKEYYSGKCYNGFEMDCADMFRHDEWKVVGDSDYAKNTCDDLFEMSSHDPKFKSFVEQVITCMKYNRSMEMD